jgi:molybdate-binding protein
MVAPGNPLGLGSLADVVRLRVRFVNRPLGSGTRVLLDDLLAGAGLGAGDLKGYGLTEPSHAAVAQAIAAGAADTGLGIELAARSRGLDFVPLAQENYHLVCLKSALEQPAIEALRQVLRHPEWQRQMGALAGYEVANCGEVLSLREMLPWWQFQRKKREIPASDSH